MVARPTEGLQTLGPLGAHWVPNATEERENMNPSDRVPASRVRLFIKPYCGWCREAMTWLDRRSIAYETLDVTADPKAWDEMIALSSQSLAPVIDVDGQVLADFGAAELERWWQQRFT